MRRAEDRHDWATTAITRISQATKYDRNIHDGKRQNDSTYKAQCHNRMAKRQRLSTFGHPEAGLGGPDINTDRDDRQTRRQHQENTKKNRQQREQNNKTRKHKKRKKKNSHKHKM